MRATVLITTKNRRDELRRLLASVLEQTAVPAQVLVVDDGSTDGTGEMVAKEFPTAEVRRSESSRGLVVQRNVGMRLARAPIVVTLDDDIVVTSPTTLAQTLRDFDDPRIGAVAIPCVDVGVMRKPRLRAPEGNGAFLTSEFTGGACAIRRDVFLGLGGYRESIFHQGEERDFCVRMLAAGWFVRVGRADPLHHYVSPTRDVRRMDLYGRRNTILYAWHNEPLPSLLVRMLEMSAQGIVSGVKVRRPVDAVHGLALGYRSCWQERSQRRPVPRDVIRVFRRLWKRGPLPLAEVERWLPMAVTPTSMETAPH